jgi:CBS domain-containing protein
MNVADIMTKEVATCGPADSLNRAAQLMWERRCGAVPVVDQDGRAVGLLTDRDVCMAAYTQGRRLDDVAVDTAMSRPARTCTTTTVVEDAEDLMMAHAVRRLVVVDPDGRVAGVVSIDDVARCGAAWDGRGDIDLERAAMALGEISRRTTTTDEDGPEQPETDLTELVENSLAVLKTLRDEMRVDLNLAGKEVRDRWRRLETRLRAAEVRARMARTDARGLAALVESAKEVRRSLRARPGKKRSHSSTGHA